MKATVLGVSERRSCRVLHAGRASLQRTLEVRSRWGRAAPTWLERLRYWIQQHPTLGYRRLWAQLRFRDGLVVNRKAVYRMLKQQRWCVHQRVAPPAPGCGAG